MQLKVDRQVPAVVRAAEVALGVTPKLIRVHVADVEQVSPDTSITSNLSEWFHQSKKSVRMVPSITSNSRLRAYLLVAGIEIKVTGRTVIAAATSAGLELAVRAAVVTTMVLGLGVAGAGALAVRAADQVRVDVHVEHQHVKVRRSQPQVALCPVQHRAKVSENNVRAT